jgi:hypothetical protein
MRLPLHGPGERVRQSDLGLDFMDWWREAEITRRRLRRLDYRRSGMRDLCSYNTRSVRHRD